jgi:hypothetical protein
MWKTFLKTPFKTLKMDETNQKTKATQFLSGLENAFNKKKDD